MSSEVNPRDRLLEYGADALTDAELFSVLFRGNRGVSAVDAARRILRDVPGFPGLLVADRRALKRSGATDSQAAAIMASIELVKRITTWRVSCRDCLDRPEAVAQHVTLHYPSVDQEIMGALYLNVRHRLIAGSAIFRGRLDRCSVEPRQILREALDHRAHGVVLWHVHPSGDIAPSDAAARALDSMADKYREIRISDADADALLPTRISFSLPACSFGRENAPGEICVSISTAARRILCLKHSNSIFKTKLLYFNPLFSDARSEPRQRARRHPLS